MGKFYNIVYNYTCISHMKELRAFLMKEDRQAPGGFQAGLDCQKEKLISQGKDSEDKGKP